MDNVEDSIPGISLRLTDVLEALSAIESLRGSKTVGGSTINRMNEALLRLEKAVGVAQAVKPLLDHLTFVLACRSIGMECVSYLEQVEQNLSEKGRDTLQLRLSIEMLKLAMAVDVESLDTLYDHHLDREISRGT